MAGIASCSAGAPSTSNSPPPSQAATPSFSVPAGTYTSVQTVSITDTTSGAAIFYTTDGSTPTAASNTYTAPVSVSTSETIEAIAVAAGFSSSPVTSAAYVITLPVVPTVTASIGASSFSLVSPPNASVQVSCDSACGQVDYRIDGSEWQTAALGASGSFSTNAFPAIAVGSHSLQVFYLGNGKYAAAASNVVGFTITAASGSVAQAKMSTNYMEYQASGVTEDVTLTNTGNAPLTISSIATGTPYFAATNNCGSSLAVNGVCTISVVDRLPYADEPYVGGASSDQLTITTNDPGGTLGVALAGFSYPNAVMPSNLVFPATALGTPVTASLTVLPDSDYTYCNASVTGSDFAVSSPTEGEENIENRFYCTYTITFTPTAAGTRTGELVFAADGTYVPLSGVGGANVSTADATLVPSAVTIRDLTGPQSVTLSNFAATAMKIQSIAISPGFSEKDNCGSSLPAQSVCTIAASSNQPVVAQSIEGTLTVTDDAGVQSALLTGAIDPIQQFGSWPVGETAPAPEYNAASGTDYVFESFTNDAFVGSGDFVGTDVKVEETVVYPVWSFKPSGTGPRSAMLTLTGAVPSYPVNTFLLEGTGVAAAGSGPLLTFGPLPTISAPVGQSVMFNPQIIDSGTTQVALTGSFTGANASEFSAESSSFCSTLEPQTECTESSVTFSPSGIGTHTANLVMTDSRSGESFTLPIVATGLPAAPSTTAAAFPDTVENTTSAALSFAVTPVAGHPVAAYIDPFQTSANGRVPLQTFTLVKNSCTQDEMACAITLEFTPPGLDTYTYYIVLVDTVTGTYSEVSGTGRGIEPASGNPVLAPSSVAFSARAVNTTSVPMTVTLSNPGTVNFTSFPPTITGTNAAEFPFTTTCGVTLAPGANCAIEISFAPVTAGSKTASVTVVYGNAQNLTSTLTGTAQ